MLSIHQRANRLKVFRSDQLSLQPFKNVLFSDLVKDKNNNVSFNLKFDIDPGLLSFEKNLTKKEESKNDTQINTIPEQQQKNDVLPELGDPKKIQ